MEASEIDMTTYHQSMTDRCAMEKARRYVRDNIARSILEPPTTPPHQLKAEMRPLQRLINFLRCDTVFVDVQLRMLPMVQRSPLCKAPEPLAKIERPLILLNPGLTFRRFSAKKQHCSHLITHH